jgi:hypothetical protein
LRILFDRTAPVADKLSGQRSCIQNITGADLINFRTSAGRPTVIGEGSYTMIMSKGPLQSIGPKMLAETAKEIKLSASRGLLPIPRDIRGALTILIPLKLSLILLRERYPWNNVPPG